LGLRVSRSERIDAGSEELDLELLGFGCAVRRLRRSPPSEAAAGEAADLQPRSDHHPEVQRLLEVLRVLLEMECLLAG
jgi:hypothetical protein